MSIAGFIPVVFMECILKIEITIDTNTIAIDILDNFISKAIRPNLFSLFALFLSIVGFFSDSDNEIKEMDCIVLVIRDTGPKSPPGRSETDFFKNS